MNNDSANIADTLTALDGKPVRLELNTRGWFLNQDTNQYTVAESKEKPGRYEFSAGDIVSRDAVDRAGLKTVEPLMERRPVTEVRGILELRLDSNQVCVWRQPTCPRGKAYRIGTPVFLREIVSANEVGVIAIHNNAPHGFDGNN